MIRSIQVFRSRRPFGLAALAAASVALAVAPACGGSSGDDDDDIAGVDAGAPAGACPAYELVGSFEISLNDGFTSVQGKVTNGVLPSLVPDLVDSDGACRLYQPPTLFCDPACSASTTCNASGACVPTPVAVSVGTVTVSGLKSPVEMTSSPPVYFYTNTGTLEHPGFDEGARISLAASGSDDVDPFGLGARGIATLATSLTSVPLERDQAVALQWDPPGSAELGTVHIDLNIAQHGGTPGRIECEVPDTGSFDLPVSLTNQLLDFGYSGFPSVAVTRRSADSTATSVGCVQLVVQSAVVLEIEIPGLTSCSGNEDCTPPETCQPDLTCG